MLAYGLGVRAARHRALLVVVLSAVCAGAANAQREQDMNKEKSARAAPPGTWQVLGRASVDFGKDKDEFKIEGADRFRRLRVQAKGSDIEMKDMDVYYEDGQHEDIEVRSTIREGQSSRPLDLKGNSKRIDKVKFSYESKASRRDTKAMVILEGQK